MWMRKEKEAKNIKLGRLLRFAAASGSLAEVERLFRSDDLKQCITLTNNAGETAVTLDLKVVFHER